MTTMNEETESGHQETETYANASTTTKNNITTKLC